MAWYFVNHRNNFTFPLNNIHIQKLHINVTDHDKAYISSYIHFYNGTFISDGPQGMHASGKPKDRLCAACCSGAVRQTGIAAVARVTSTGCRTIRSWLRNTE
jgi:hypothetical protein